MPAPTRRGQGRPAATDHATIERTAFSLFEQQGFDNTTMDQIADAVGVGKRTLFRYFPSKSDIPWGQFGESLASFRGIFAAMPADLPLWTAVHDGILAFNDFGPEVVPLHRQRMQLILSTPALQAHSALQYAEWRRVIAEFVASRTGDDPTGLFPILVGHTGLAVAVTAYEMWLVDESRDLRSLLEEATRGLQDLLGR